MIKTIILIFVGSITTILGAIVNHLAFWPEVELLNRQYLVDRASVYTTKRSCDVLYKAVSRHQHAVSEFRHHLKCVDRHRLDKAWKQYCKEGNNIHYFSEEYPCDDEFKQHSSEKKALGRLNELLAFAEPR